MGFDVDFTPTTPPPIKTPAEIYAERTAFLAKMQVSNDANFVIDRYNEAWIYHDTKPQDVVDRFKALETGAKTAFSLIAIRVSGLIQMFSMFPGSESIIGELQALGIPSGWTVPFNEDGSVGEIIYPINSSSSSSSSSS